MKQDFIPRRDADLDTWEDQFTDELPNVAAALNLTTGQVTAITDKINAHRGLYTLSVSKKNAAQAAVDAARREQVSTVSDIRKIARLIKAQPTYTEELGKLLGIVGDEHVVDLSDAKPTLSVKLEGGNRVVKFNKDDSDGIRLYSRVGGQGPFIFLAVDTESPYVDNRERFNNGQPTNPDGNTSAPTNVIEYQAYYILGDEQVGQASDIVSIPL